MRVETSSKMRLSSAEVLKKHLSTPDCLVEDGKNIKQLIDGSRHRTLLILIQHGDGERTVFFQTR